VLPPDGRSFGGQAGAAARIESYVGFQFITSTNVEARSWEAPGDDRVV
jgi:hypothetical protein